jgi:small subunit ribosomal protein S6
MKKYEALFILNLTGREDSLKDVIDRLTAEMTAAGCQVETVQKMDRRAFARVSSKKVAAGHYVNFIFQAEPSVLPGLRHRFTLDEEVYRMMLTIAPAVDESPKLATAES